MLAHISDRSAKSQPRLFHPNFFKISFLQIDWGGGEGGDNGIDFGDDIDFDITDITVESGGAETAENSDSIDWGCTSDSAASLREGNINYYLLLS
jgi:hypothetical protein